MTNKDLDKILKTLEDFDPQAKPNWEAFVAGNEARLESTDKTIDQLTGKAAKSFTGIKYAAIMLTVIAGIFFIWYFSGPGSDVSIPQNAIPEAIQAPATLPNNNIDQPSIKEIIPSATDKPDVSREFLNESIIVDDLNTTSDTESIGGSSGIIDLPLIEEPLPISTAQSEKLVVIKITDTVYIKKTIIISDTLKVKKAPIKN